MRLKCALFAKNSFVEEQKLTYVELFQIFFELFFRTSLDLFRKYHLTPPKEDRSGTINVRWKMGREFDNEI